ncbi:MAG: DUF6263 family protein [Flavisolibacter sp.]
MIHRSILLFIGFSLLFVSCNTNDKGKQNEKRSADSTTNERLPAPDTSTASIRKEFADTVAAKKPSNQLVLLKFNLQKGKTYNYIMTLDVSQKKGEQLRSTEMGWNYDLKVIDIKTGQTTLEATYKRIDMTMNMGKDQKMEFSSEKKVEAMDFMQMPSKMFGIIKGKSFTMQVNEKGEVVGVSGIDKIGETVVNEMGLPEEMKPMARQTFQRQFNDDAVKQLFSQTFNVVPDKAVKIGDSWKASSDLTSIKQTVATVYKVKNIRDNRVYLTGDSKINSTDGKNAATQKSQLMIDSKTGLMIDGLFNQKADDGNTTTKTRIRGKES